MSSNLSLNDLSVNLSTNEVVILNTVVNNNIILVQYTRGTNKSPVDYTDMSNIAPAQKHGGVVQCFTKLSFDHGKTWKELDLDLGGETYNKYGIKTNEAYGNNGALVSFIVRHHSGGKLLMFTPIYRVCPTYKDEIHLVPHALVTIAGWLVHDETGRRHNKYSPFPMKEFDNSLDISFLSKLSGDITINTTTAKINLLSADKETGLLAKAFLAYPYEGQLDSDKSLGTYDTKITNLMDTVDHEFAGNHYTVVKRYFNVFFRKGNIFTDYDPTTPDKPPSKYGVDYYVVTLPFLYVFDHRGFNDDVKAFTWVDVLGLVNNTKSLIGSARGSTKTNDFIRSLISNDHNFLKITQNNNAYYKFATNDAIPLSTSFVFTKTPHGEIFTYRDKSNDRSLTGFIHCNRQLVCYSDPTQLGNWKRIQSTPQSSRSTFVTLISLNLLTTQGIQTLPDYNTRLHIHYTSVQTYYSNQGSITFSKDTDKLVLVPSMVNNELVYRPVCFTKDNVIGKYGIGMLDMVSSIGYRGITGNIYSGDIDNYPIQMKNLLGVLYDTSGFLKSATVNYLNETSTGVEVIEPSFEVLNP